MLGWLFLLLILAVLTFTVSKTEAARMATTPTGRFYDVKPGASLEGITPAALAAIDAAVEIWNVNNLTLTVTSGTDPAPDRVGMSGHSTGRAVDFRRPDWPDFNDPHRAGRFADLLRVMLGPTYFILLESDHIHVERRVGV